MKSLQKLIPKIDLSRIKTEMCLSNYFSSKELLGSIVPEEVSNLERYIVEHRVTNFNHVGESLGLTLDQKSGKEIAPILTARLGRKLAILKTNDRLDVISLLGELGTAIGERLITTGDDELDKHYLGIPLKIADKLENIVSSSKEVLDYKEMIVFSERLKGIASYNLQNPKEDFNKKDISKLKKVKRTIESVILKSQPLAESNVEFEGFINRELVIASMFKDTYSRVREPSLIEKVQTGIARKRLEWAYSKYGEQASQYDLTSQEAAQRTLELLVPEGENYSPLSVLGLTTRYVKMIMKVPDDAWITENPTAKKPMLSSLNLKVNSILWNPNDFDLKERKEHIKNSYKRTKEYVAKKRNIIVNCL